MSDMKHTPGPWAYTEAAITGDRGIHAEGTGIFAEAFADIRRACENNTAEAEANARLIAAAPDMLEALKALRLQALQSNVNSAANEWGLEALAMANAAIAKASGATWKWTIINGEWVKVPMVLTKTDKGWKERPEKE